MTSEYFRRRHPEIDGEAVGELSNEGKWEIIKMRDIVIITSDICTLAGTGFKLVINSQVCTIAGTCFKILVINSQVSYLAYIERVKL